MSPKDCAYIVERLAIRFMALVTDHERQLTEHRAAFGARTEADAKIIAGLREELEGVGKGEGIRKSAERLVQERDALRAEVAELKTQLERLTSWAAKNQAARETLQNEIEKLKSQTPKEHPVKVGEWVRRLVPSPACDVGTVAKVVHVDDDTSEIEYDVKRIDGQHGVWFAKNCEPCDPPIVKREPTIGDTVRLVKIPIMGAVSPELQRVLEWPWIERWGTLNQTALVVEPAYQLEGALSVCLRTNVHVRWPVCCIEVVSEANHDTEAGKAVAESAVSETVADEIKVGDVVKVVGASGDLTVDELTERYEQTPPEATHAEPDLTQLHAKGKEAWSDVPNATQWVEEMRGNSEAMHDTEAGKAAAESAAHSAEIDIGTRSRKVTT